jgi:hypothetical protein
MTGKQVLHYVFITRIPFSSPALVSRSKCRNEQPGAGCSGRCHEYDYEHEQEQEQETLNPTG